MYLKNFLFPGIGREEQFLNKIQRTCYDTFYLFGILTKHDTIFSKNMNGSLDDLISDNGRKI